MKRTSCMFVMIVFVFSGVAHAVMPPSTSLEDSVSVVHSNSEPHERYQIVAGRVTLLGSPKTKPPQEIDTIIKLDKETGRSWILDILPDAGRRWVEVKSAS